MRFAATILALIFSVPSPQATVQHCDACVKPKPVYKVSKLSLSDVGISCTNGADPTIAGNFGGTLIVSCDDTRKSKIIN